MGTLMCYFDIENPENRFIGIYCFQGMNSIMEFQLHFQGLRLKASIYQLLISFGSNCGSLKYHWDVESFLILNIAYFTFMMSHPDSQSGTG